MMLMFLIDGECWVHFALKQMMPEIVLQLDDWCREQTKTNGAHNEAHEESFVSQTYTRQAI